MDVKPIIDEMRKSGIPAGFSQMGLIGKAIKKIEGRGIAIKNQQELRSAIVKYNEKVYIAFLVDAVNGDQYWGVFESITTGPFTARGVWKGYTKWQR